MASLSDQNEQQLLQQLIRDEGMRLHPYKDTVGKLTIGIGRNLDDVGISEGEAQTLCTNDISHALASLDANLPWTGGLDEVRLAALTNMCFNIGIGRLMGFKNFLAALEAGDYAKAGEEMESSLWYGQVGARAYRLKIQIETGEWQ